MRIVHWVIVGALTWTMAACAPVQRFPSDIEKRVVMEPTHEFGVLHMEPEVYRGGGTLLAGTIIDVEPISSGVLLVTQRLPVLRQVDYPSYRPMETSPTDQSILFYPGHIDPQGLKLGNKFIALADPKEFPGVTIKGVSKSSRYFVASCLHIWKTGHNEISDFRDRYNQTYARLEEDTYCTKSVVPTP